MMVDKPGVCIYCKDLDKSWCSHIDKWIPEVGFGREEIGSTKGFSSTDFFDLETWNEKAIAMAQDFNTKWYVSIKPRILWDRFTRWIRHQYYVKETRRVEKFLPKLRIYSDGHKEIIDPNE